MKLYDIIQNLGSTKEGRANYFSSSNNALILFSNIFSTNTRTVNAYISYIEKFEKYINLERDKWEKAISTNQEKAKHFVKPLISAELIYKDENNLYQYTEKTRIINKIKEIEFTKIEKMILNSIILSNYKLINKDSLATDAIDCYDILYSLEYNREQLVFESINCIENGFSNNGSKLFLYMIFFREGLEDLPNILSIIKNSTNKEITEFYEMIDFELKTKNYKSHLSKRLKSGGSLTKDTITNMYVMFVIQLEIADADGDYGKIIDKILTPFEKLDKFNKQKLIKCLNNEEVKNVVAKVLEDVNPNIDITVNLDKNNKVTPDVSTKTSKISNEEIFNSLKKTVLENSNYTCQLESFRNCKRLNFTSRSTKKTYLEVHHFLPRKYNSYIKNGVEFIENYIPLCPSCHRMIHLATDYERRSILNYILNENEVIADILNKSEIDKCKDIYEKIEVLYDFE